MIIDYHIEDHMSKRLEADEKRRLKEIAWKNAIKNGSYGSNQGKFFLLYPDGSYTMSEDEVEKAGSGDFSTPIYKNEKWVAGAEVEEADF